MSHRPAPRFQPRRRGRAAQPARRWPWYAAGAGVLVLAAAGIVAGILLSGDDDDAPPATPTSQSTAGSADGREPMVQGPSYSYVVQTADLPGYEVNQLETYLLSALGFATDGPFANSDEGEQLAEEWGYRDGYKASIRPIGQLAEVVQGKYYVTTESYVFEGVAGARSAFDQFERTYDGIPGSIRQETNPLANESGAWKFVQGVVGTTELPAAYYRFLFRRGNLVSVVQVFGADQYMTVDKARDLAALVDEKVLGERPAPSPTPGGAATVPPSP